MFFCKKKTAYEMRISYWSSDVCSSDLRVLRCHGEHGRHGKMNNFEHDHSFLLFSSLVDGGRREGSFTSSTVLRRLEAERQLDPISPRLAECHRGDRTIVV